MHYFFADGAFLRRFQNKIHIKLPTCDELAVLILKKLDIIPQGTHNLLQFEIDILARTLFQKGFSPFDLDRLLGHVSTQKLQLFKQGTHFKKDKFGVYFMCKNNEPGAVRMTYKKVRNMPFKLPIICLKDLSNGLRQIRATNGKMADLKFETWKKENQIE